MGSMKEEGRGMWRGPGLVCRTGLMVLRESRMTGKTSGLLVFENGGIL